MIPAGIPKGINVWVFDLDNTLYPASELYRDIEARMTAYIARVLAIDTPAARELRERYFLQYGATVVGLQRHHGVDAADFLSDAHKVDHSVLSADDRLRAQIAALPGRRIVFTNGGGGHGERVIQSLGLTEVFEAVFDIEASGLAPKPQPEAYARLVERFGFDPRQAMLIEDTPRNLEPAHAMGFAAALVGDGHGEPLPAYVRHRARDLRTLLAGWVG